MAFKHAGTLTPYGAPVKIAVVAANSITVTELDAIKVSSGFAALGTAGVSLYGHVTAIRTNKGVGLSSDGTTGAEYGSFTGTYTFASDNQTNAQNKVELDVSKFSLYSAEVDATIGTTTGSNLRGYFMDLVDEDTLDESTAATTAAQYATHGVDANDTSKAIVNLFESALFGPLSA